METIQTEQTKTKTAEADSKAKAAANKTIAPEEPAAQFIATLIGGAATTKKDELAKPKREAKPKEEGDEDGDGNDADERAKPAAKKKEKPAALPASVIDEEKLGQSIGKSIAEHSAKTAAAGSKTGETEEPKLSPKDARRIAVMERMEKLNPEQYSGLSKRYMESKAKLRDYADKWEKANPGEKFDDAADEHADFIEALEAQVAYEDEDFIDAQADIRAEEKFDSKKVELDQRLSKIEEAERKRAEFPKIQKAAVTAGNDFWKRMGDDFAGVVDENGEINQEALAEMQKSDPVKFDVTTRAAYKTEVMAATIYALANRIENYDPKNDAHALVTRFAIEREAEMMNRAEDKRRDESGRMFVRKADYDRMNQAQRDKHWTFSPEELVFMAVQEESRNAAKILKLEDEKFVKRAQARGLIAEEANPEHAAKREVQHSRADDSDDDDEQASATVRKPVSPTVSSSPKLAAAKGGSAAAPKNGLEGFIQKMIG